jgi:glycosyltransferase involved in cell wall biosynthesis
LLTGWIDGDIKLFALRNAGLLALPSYHENFGVSVIEALASGLPVLVSPTVNLASEIENAEAGWVAKVEVSAIEQALEVALSSADERRRRGHNGLNLARKFDWSLISEDLVQLYSQAANGTRVQVSKPQLGRAACPR